MYDSEVSHRDRQSEANEKTLEQVKKNLGHWEEGRECELGEGMNRTYRGKYRRKCTRAQEEESEREGEKERDRYKDSA